MDPTMKKLGLRGHLICHWITKNSWTNAVLALCQSTDLLHYYTKILKKKICYEILKYHMLKCPIKMAKQRLADLGIIDDR